MKSRLSPIWLVRLVLAVYFATVPLYGMAATVAALACQPDLAVGVAEQSQHHPEETHHASQAPATSQGHVPQADADDSSGEGDGGYLGHLCCQLVMTALPSQTSFVEPATYSPQPSSPDVFHYVTFLEHFQRPPLG
jgi:hypothetical protein